MCADHFQKGLESLTAKRQRQEGRDEKQERVEACRRQCAVV